LRLVRPILALALLVAIAMPAGAHGATGGLYVSSFNEGQVAQLDIGPGGLLTPKLPAGVAASAAKGLDGIAITPDGTSLYASVRSGAIAQFTIGAGGLLIPKSPATVPTPAGMTGRLAISPEGNSLYAAYGMGVAQYDIGHDGLLSPKSPASVAVLAPLAVAVSPDGGSAYAASSSTIFEFDVGAGGRLTPKSTPSVSGGGIWISMRPDGRSLYAGADSILGGIRQYDVGPAGALAPKAPATVGIDRDRQLAISPDGNSLYAADFNLDSISQYDIGADGRLTPKAAGATLAGGTGPTGVAVSPDGASVYLGNFGGSEGGETTISQYTAGSGGALTPKSPATVTTGPGPWWMFALPDQGPTAAFRVKRAAAGSPVAFDGSSSHDPDGSVARFDWDFGDGSQTTDGPAAIKHTFARGTYHVTLTAIDDAGCSNRIVFNGQTALCNGTGAATKTTSVIVPRAFRGVILKKQTAKVRGRAFRVKVGCPKGIEGPCKGKLVLPKLALVKFSIPAGRSKRLRLKLSRSALGRLHRTGGVRTKVKAIARDGFGVKKTARAGITLKP
jgi:DNA-binding beta-propeller fold protein YncE